MKIFKLNQLNKRELSVVNGGADGTDPIDPIDPGLGSCNCSCVAGGSQKRTKRRGIRKQYGTK